MTINNENKICNINIIVDTKNINDKMSNKQFSYYYWYK